MKKLMMMTAVVAVVLMMSACGNKTNKSAGDAEVPADSVTQETVESSVDKHTEAYLSERVDSIYFNYKNPK